MKPKFNKRKIGEKAIVACGWKRGGQELTRRLNLPGWLTTCRFSANSHVTKLN